MAIALATDSAFYIALMVRLLKGGGKVKIFLEAAKLGYFRNPKVGIYKKQLLGLFHTNISTLFIY